MTFVRTILDPWDKMRKRTNLPSTPQTLWFDWPLSGAARSDCDAVLMTSELAPHKTRQTRTATLPGGYHSSQWSYHVSTCFYMYLLCVWHSTKIKRDPYVACDGPGWHLVDFQRLLGNRASQSHKQSGPKSSSLKGWKNFGFGDTILTVFSHVTSRACPWIPSIQIT